jgi:hypothetical protein
MTLLKQKQFINYYSSNFMNEVFLTVNSSLTCSLLYTKQNICTFTRSDINVLISTSSSACRWHERKGAIYISNIVSLECATWIRKTETYKEYRWNTVTSGIKGILKWVQLWWIVMVYSNKEDLIFWHYPLSQNSDGRFRKSYSPLLRIETSVLQNIWDFYTEVMDSTRNITLFY